MKLKNKVLVCGGDNLTSLGIVRELGSQNIPFTFISIGKSKVVARSKYCKDIHLVKNLDACIEHLKTNYRHEEYKPILIISSDRLACMFDTYQDSDFANFILSCTSRPGSLLYYTNKYNMQMLAQELGISCLESLKINKSSSLDGITYPCFLKPCIEQNGHYNEFKYKICKNEQELRSTLEMVRPESEFVAQRFLNKENELVVYGCRMRDGKTIISGVMYQDRFAESGFASHGYITKDIPSFIDIDKLTLFLETVDYYGPFDFEFAIENGIPYYLETNFRCVGPTCFFNKGGANIVAAYVYSCANLPYDQLSCFVQQDAWCIDDMYDIENVLTRKMSYKAWKRSKNEAAINRFYDNEDINPYKAERKRRLIKIFKDIFVKRFRLYIVYWGEKIGLRK